MKTEQQITFKDIILIVSGTYTLPEEKAYNYPGAPSDFSIDKITLEDSNTDIWNLLSFDDLNVIEELVIKEIEE